MKNENTASVHEEVTMQLDCKMFICKKCLQASGICISVQENFVQAVTEKHSSFAFLSTELKGKKGFCRRLNGYFLFPTHQQYHCIWML